MGQSIAQTVDIYRGLSQRFYSTATFDLILPALIWEQVGYGHLLILMSSSGHDWGSGLRPRGLRIGLSNNSTSRSSESITAQCTPLTLEHTAWLCPPQSVRKQ